MPSIKSVSAAQSVVSTDKSVMDADGVEVCTVYITANLDFQDDDGQPYPIGGVPASLVTIAIAEGGVVITQPSGNLDANGNTTATFTASTATNKTVVATINGVAATSSPVVVAGGTVDPPAPGDPFFTDTFAGPAKNDSGGFTWATTGARVAAVSFDGGNCLRFRYGPDAVGADSSAEQRFNMGRDLTELWLEYYVHIPSNFALRNEAPANNKFLFFWPVDYAVGPTAGLEYDRNGTDTSYARMLSLSEQYPGALVRGGDAIQNSNFISAARANAWSRIRVHYKLSSGTGQTDGIFEGWIGNDLMFRSRTDWTFWYAGGDNFARNGYFFGWANSGYTAETDFHIKGGTDGPKFYDADPEWTF